jgi:hypothetical protein
VLSRYATPIYADRVFIVLVGGYSRIFGPTETAQEVRNNVEWLSGHLGFLRLRYADVRRRNKNHHNNGEFHRGPRLVQIVCRIFEFGAMIQKPTLCSALHKRRQKPGGEALNNVEGSRGTRWSAGRKN